MSEQIISLTEFKASASRLLESTRAGENLILTQNGSASAVVQDYDSYQKQRQAFLMLKLLVQGEADIQNNRTKPQKQVFSELRASLKARAGKE
ncbi:type II toxin-antitoxin system Phd/YefM family antitoxin [Leucothrix mucor]|uniref:type II toxin-antitoxin system Phd/YefM family antitoxin n=1 Tax=Leucothrix mucor TaxID=45248 RepID=UPI0003B5F14C|nr:type II toxin-antitoxin system Phd/YefM family antitoxin [Leucothrix mucor]